MKKTLAAILALVLTLSLSTLAWAEDETGLPEATSGVILLTSDAKLAKDVDFVNTVIRVPAGKSVTLDLNGNVIKAANTLNSGIEIYGNLILTDSKDTNKDGTGGGKIYTDSVYVYGSVDQPVVRVYDGGNFTMESGLIDTATGIQNNTASGQFAIGLRASNEGGVATATINGGRVVAGWYAMAGNGTDKGLSNITINGGRLESTADYAIYQPHNGTTTVNDGVVYGVAGGVALNKGDLIVNGGTITSKGTGNTGNWGDGTGNMAAAAVNVQAKYGEATATVKGGTLIAEKNALFIENKENGSISVEAGTFSQPVNEYLADTVNYMVSSTNSVSYFTNLNDAVAAAGADDEVKNLKETAAHSGSTITLKDGDTVITKLHTEAATVELPTLTKSGYTFKGWKDEDGKVYNGKLTISEENDGELVVREEVTLTAVWSANSYYYYPSTTTDTAKTDSPKTFDAGVALYAGMALASLTGLAYTGKKKF